MLPLLFAKDKIGHFRARCSWTVTSPNLQGYQNCCPITDAQMLGQIDERTVFNDVIDLELCGVLSIFYI